MPRMLGKALKRNTKFKSGKTIVCFCIECDGLFDKTKHIQRKLEEKQWRKEYDDERS
ncbi:hypothetical protein FDI69_gp023 [Rhodococcus phage Trina]|uniref:Uncharacterized protein n=1 Tax=Rhodococcus phage Trina TaxID=2027905 RepID=A0A2D0ZMC6_9CAUD|nr:hypothetical protein FDI69_gp023 [Rhodococcus phage Trina]ASZ75065.1 hypothetical protein SEA_TRINA_23 [Rhodococcus phage Trina]